MTAMPIPSKATPVSVSSNNAQAINAVEGGVRKKRLATLTALPLRIGLRRMEEFEF